MYTHCRTKFRSTSYLGSTAVAAQVLQYARSRSKQLHAVEHLQGLPQIKVQTLNEGQVTRSQQLSTPNAVGTVR